MRESIIKEVNKLTDQISGQIDIVEIVIEYVEERVRSFLKRHGLNDDIFKALMEEADKCDTVFDYINTLTNGVVQKVADSTDKSKEEIYDEFAKFYLTGK